MLLRKVRALIVLTTDKHSPGMLCLDRQDSPNKWWSRHWQHNCCLTCNTEMTKFSGQLKQKSLNEWSIQNRNEFWMKHGVCCGHTRGCAGGCLVTCRTGLPPPWRVPTEDELVVEGPIGFVESWERAQCYRWFSVQRIGWPNFNKRTIQTRERVCFKCI
jgi:hypothetical protein